MSLVLLVILIIVLVNNGHLKDEIEELKKHNYNYCPKCGHQLNKSLSKQTVVNQPIQEKTNNNIEMKVEKELSKKPKNNMSDEEVKNNIILITGSILIILAAVIYLTSSWSVTSNVLKCVVIFIMFFVFVFASYLAKEKLQLTQTARAFKYIALAYLPLSLISLSIFGLLGENFSINGDYQNLYLAITLFICSAIYYFESKKDKDVFLSISTIISSILGVIFFVLAFTESLLILIIFLFLYSYFLALLYKYKQYIYDEKFTRVTLIVLFYTLFGITALLNFVLLFLTDLSTSELLQSILVLLLNVGLSIILGNKQLNRYLIPISIVLLFNFIRVSGNMHDYMQEIIILLSIPVIYVYNYLTEKKINVFNFVLCSFVVFIVFCASSLEISKEIISDCYISLIYVVILAVTLLISSNLKKAIAWMLPIFIELTAIAFVVEYELSINVLLGISTLLVAASLIPKLKNYTKEIVIIPTVLNAIYILIAYEEKSLITFLLTVVSIVVCYLLILRNNNNYKYPMYLFINLGMIYLGHIICNGLSAYTMALSIILIIALEVMDERLKDDGNFAYIIVDYIITVICLTDVDKRTAFIMTIIIALVFFAYLLDNKKNIGLYNIPLLTPLMYIATSSVMTFNSFNVMPVLAIIIAVSVPFLLIKNKNYIVLAAVPYLYLLMLTTMDISIYFPYVLGLCISLAYFVLSDKNVIFKILSVITSLLLYYKIINDLELKATIFTIGVLLIYTLFVTRNIMSKQDSKVIEYILMILINLIAISFYTNEADGMVYVILLLIITIFSYLKKYGPAFLVSIIFILINMFLLTRLFWLSLPWWIYILGVGIILILFAVLNEINEKDNIKNKLIDFKNNLKL